MLRLLIDENLNHAILRGLRRRIGELDIVTVQSEGLTGIDDITILAWAADANRIVITHDVTTMTQYAYDRLDAGESMPGIFAVGLLVAVGKVIDDLVLIVECSQMEDWNGKVTYIPLR